MITLIAAMDRNRAIGRGGDMPWHLPDDLKRFKALTLGKPVLMGRKTAVAIGRLLPGRENLVLTRGDTAPFTGQTVVHSLNDAIAHARDRELCVIGGGEVYRIALPSATHLALTEIDASTADADTFFPRFDPNAWREVDRQRHAADARHPFAFDFVDYERKERGQVHFPMEPTPDGDARKHGPGPVPDRTDGAPAIEVAAGVLVDAGGRTLLIQRMPGKHLAGKWEFPGGKVEAGETIQRALARELDEELGVTVLAAAPLITVAWRYPEKSVRLHVLRVTEWRGAPTAREGNPMRWVAPSEMDPAEMPAADGGIVTALRAASTRA